MGRDSAIPLSIDLAFKVSIPALILAPGTNRSRCVGDFCLYFGDFDDPAASFDGVI